METYFRSKISDNKRTVWENQSTSGKILWNYLFFLCKNYTTMFHITILYCQLLYVFCCGFGKRSVPIARSDEAKFKYFKHPKWIIFDRPLIFYRFPFDWMNPVGYLIPMVLQYVQVTYEFSLIACLVSFALGAFLYAICFVKDVKISLNLLNEDWRKSRKYKRNIAHKRLQTHKAKLKMSKQLCNLVECHGILKKFSLPGWHLFWIFWIF